MDKGFSGKNPRWIPYKGNPKTVSEMAQAVSDYSDQMIEEWDVEDDLKGVPEKHRLMTRLVLAHVKRVLRSKTG